MNRRECEEEIAEARAQGVREGRAQAFDEALEIATELRTRWETGESSRAWGAVAALEEFAERTRSLGADAIEPLIRAEYEERIATLTDALGNLVEAADPPDDHSDDGGMFAQGFLDASIAAARAVLAAQEETP